ncbi:hypothetical protein LDENG_00127910 [Lucifuga dentata]|nr:hypothetical protein LDENG_00127910 [Lucifuga dentata]
MGAEEGSWRRAQQRYHSITLPSAHADELDLGQGTVHREKAYLALCCQVSQWEASRVRGQLHQGAGRHHPQGLLRHAGCQTQRHLRGGEQGVPEACSVAASR